MTAPHPAMTGTGVHHPVLMATGQSKQMIERGFADGFLFRCSQEECDVADGGSEF